MKQTVLTIITAIDPNKEADLTDLLGKIQSDLSGNPYIPFASLDLLHFASFVIAGRADSPVMLIFENNFDGDLSNYLDELLRIAGNGLDQIYQCCTAYQRSTYQPQKLKDFLTAHVVKPNAFYTGNVGRRACDIRQNRQLRQNIQIYLDQILNGKTNRKLTPFELRQEIQHFIQTFHAGLSTPLAIHQTVAERVMPWIKVAFVVPFVIAFLPAILIVRWKESQDQEYKNQADNAHVTALMGTENRITQNHLASITTIKPGWFRLNVLRGVLFVANLLAQTSNKGKLSGIPSIHFAHWSIIDNKQLLFLSNFDGSWSSYLDDFIDKASRGLTGIWSNTAGFPKTRFLIFDGATDELHFKAFARNSQVPSQVWYSAYPDLTVQNIDKDSNIRENLLTDLSEAETKNWLKLF